MGQVISIRRAEEADVPLLACLVREAFRGVAARFGLTPENCPKHPSNCTPEWIRHALTRGVCHFLAFRAEAPCGCVALEQARPDVCYLERLGVLPEHRNKGVGSALVARAVGEARRFGAERVEIGVIAADATLVSWYEGQGFVGLRTADFAHLPFEVRFLALRL